MSKPQGQDDAASESVELATEPHCTTSANKTIMPGEDHPGPLPKGYMLFCGTCVCSGRRPRRPLCAKPHAWRHGLLGRRPLQ